MYHYQENITDSNGTALNGWSIGLYAVGGDPATAPAITIYGDRAGAAPVPGGTVRAYDKGFVSFYVPNGIYSRRYYDGSGILQTTVTDTDMGMFGTGALPSGVWVGFTGLPRLKLGGTGTVSIDTNTKLDGSGTTTTGVFTATTSGTTTIAFPFFGNDAVAVRATLTGTATAEII
jgi:hypothetical protein